CAWASPRATVADCALALWVADRACLPPPRAQASGRVILTSGPYVLGALSAAFAALADKLPVEQAGKQASTLAGQTDRAARTHHESLILPNGMHPVFLTLSEAFTVLAGKLPVEQARKLATTLADWLIEEASSPWRDRERRDPWAFFSLRRMSEAFAALASKL